MTPDVSEERKADPGEPARRLLGAMRQAEPGVRVRGSTESAITSAEESLGARFPAVYRALLLEVGHHPGAFMRGSDFARPEELAEFRADAIELLEEWGVPAATFPERAVVFCLHQGYNLLYFLPDDGFDVAVFSCAEGGTAPERAYGSFRELCDEWVELFRRQARR